jgi:hypothetical protein
VSPSQNLSTWPKGYYHALILPATICGRELQICLPVAPLAHSRSQQANAKNTMVPSPARLVDAPPRTHGTDATTQGSEGTTRQWAKPTTLRPWSAGCITAVESGRRSRSFTSRYVTNISCSCGPRRVFFLMLLYLQQEYLCRLRLFTM